MTRAFAIGLALAMAGCGAAGNGGAQLGTAGAGGSAGGSAGGAGAAGASGAAGAGSAAGASGAACIASDSPYGCGAMLQGTALPEQADCAAASGWIEGNKPDANGQIPNVPLPGDPGTWGDCAWKSCVDAVSTVSAPDSGCLITVNVPQGCLTAPLANYCNLETFNLVDAATDTPMPRDQQCAANGWAEIGGAGNIFYPPNPTFRLKLCGSLCASATLKGVWGCYTPGKTSTNHYPNECRGAATTQTRCP